MKSASLGHISKNNIMTGFLLPEFLCNQNFSVSVSVMGRTCNHMVWVQCNSILEVFLRFLFRPFSAISFKGSVKMKSKN